MLVYPEFDPILIQIGPVAVRWYGLMYVVGFALAWLLGVYRAKQPNSGWTAEQVGDLIFFGALGVIFGGRIGYLLFYDLPGLFQDPLSLIKLWEPGRSFHGGLIGVALALWWFARKFNKSFLDITDFIAPMAPVGLAAGRIGNFINGELWGKATSMPWGMIFPHVDNQARHPSQLYEFFLEGVLLFIVLWFYSAKPRARGAVTGLFLIGYGLVRCFVELFRQPDAQFGYLAFGWVTMGQVLSLPMIILGLYLFARAKQQGDMNATVS